MKTIMKNPQSSFHPQFESPVHFFKAPLRVLFKPARKQGNKQARKESRAVRIARARLQALDGENVLAVEKAGYQEG